MDSVPKKTTATLFVPRDEALHGEYVKGWITTDIFPVNVLGFQSHRDAFAIAFDRASIKERLRNMLDSTLSDSEVRTQYSLRDTKDWNITHARHALRNLENPVTKICECSFRPFDQRWCYLGREFMDRPRNELLEHVAHRDNICLNALRQTKVKKWRHVLVSNGPAPAVYIEIKDGSTVFPLYIYPHTAQESSSSREPNLNPKFIRAFASNIGLIFKPDGVGNPTTEFGPEDLFHYIYAVSHSPRIPPPIRRFPEIGLPPDPATRG